MASVSEDIIDLICERLGEMEASGRKPANLVLGNREAAELTQALHRKARIWRGILGEVIAIDEEFTPDLSLTMGPATFFGVPLERVDRPSFLGVVAEGD